MSRDAAISRSRSERSKWISPLAVVAAVKIQASLRGKAARATLAFEKARTEDALEAEKLKNARTLKEEEEARKEAAEQLVEAPAHRVNPCGVIAGQVGPLRWVRREMEEAWAGKGARVRLPQSGLLSAHLRSEERYPQLTL